MTFGLLPAPYVYSMIFEWNKEYCRKVAEGCEKRNLAMIVVSFASILGLVCLVISIKSRKLKRNQASAPETHEEKDGLLLPEE